MTYRKVLGNWGEVHACRLLKSAKFTDIVPLNVGRQHPAGDVMAKKNGRVGCITPSAAEEKGSTT